MRKLWKMFQIEIIYLIGKRGTRISIQRTLHIMTDQLPGTTGSSMGWSDSGLLVTHVLPALLRKPLFLLVLGVCSHIHDFTHHLYHYDRLDSLRFIYRHLKFSQTSVLTSAVINISLHCFHFPCNYAHTPSDSTWGFSSGSSSVTCSPFPAPPPLPTIPLFGIYTHHNTQPPLFLLLYSSLPYVLSYVKTNDACVVSIYLSPAPDVWSVLDSLESE